nr:response regulator [Geothrix oryzisoli]
MVDDDLLLLKSVRRVFSQHHQVRTASSGREALAILAGLPPPAVAMVDYQMPGMSGIELLKKLREASPDTVRIMLTGQADLPTAIQAVNQGQVFRFLTKPVNVLTLQEVIVESLRTYGQRLEENRLMAEAVARRQAEAPVPEAAALMQLLEARLTPREQEVLGLIGRGNSSKEIGLRLGISHRTVDVHRSHILEKLGLHNSTSLVRVALKAGLI